MEVQRMGNGRANALKDGREIVVAVDEACAATAADVYDTLADLRSHLTWGGERQGKKTRLLSIEAPEGPAVAGTEFRTTGVDPMGGFSDSSVVTEASRPRTFEFVTEARLTTKKGKVVDWTNVHRYELTPIEPGCRIEYTFTVSRISELPGMLRMFDVPFLRTVASKASASLARKGVKNLAAFAETRS